MDPVLEHFTRRADFYDRSSRWCTDPQLGAATVDAVAPEASQRLLDVACGTGLVSALFKGKVSEVVGLDRTPAMFAQARPHVDRLVEGDATALPFGHRTFDRVICRQGIQFMDDQKAVREMVRVCKPGGRVVLVHLCAYGEEDKADYFEILRLRNPARRNFYLREDLTQLLENAGCRKTEVRDYISDEDVEAWADNQAVESEAVRAIRAIYERPGNETFHALHGVRQQDGRIFDRMLFGIAIGYV